MWGKRGRTSAGSDVIMLEDHPMASEPEMPAIANLNVTNSSRVHLGPKFVNVNQTVHNSEVIKGQILGLELVSGIASRQLRCSVAVFVCWSFLVASALATGIFFFVFNKKQTLLDIGIKEPWYLRREDWQAMPAYDVEFLQLPVRYVIIGHSASPYCTEKYSCIEKVLEIQQDHLRRFGDIGPNFLISGNGLIFEGSGANAVGAMVISWNTKSVTVMFMGDYRYDPVTPPQIQHLQILLDTLMNLNILSENYVMFGHCQVWTHMITPGPNIMHSLHNFTNWNSTNSNLCLNE